MTADRTTRTQKLCSHSETSRLIIAFILGGLTVKNLSTTTSACSSFVTLPNTEAISPAVEKNFTEQHTVQNNTTSEGNNSIPWNRTPPRESETKDNRSFRFPESNMMHKWLDGMYGLEIGASTHNGYGLNTSNVDYTGDETVFQTEQIKLAKLSRYVDIIAPGNQLPHADASVDFVISSHAIEHFHDPIGAICEWLRVVKPGGLVATVAPHKMRTFDKDRPRTTLDELRDRHQNPIDPAQDDHHHWSVWITEDFLELCKYMGWLVAEYLDKDDKVGNGFAVVIVNHIGSRSKC